MPQELKLKSCKALQTYLQDMEQKTYQSVLNKAVKDKHFERAVRAMTVDKMFGGSSLSKYNKI